ncbi:MAG: hypothetical protein EAZ76_04755 [Nostocales cyanobacterium]|nr:MAG: hypothetical protein EAZ87_24590 [Nostocales cyanobacterium]TAF18563.1 MAG: hypothetical protein EAZ76_04755 [Nostocales cyanobacterium]
MSIIALRAWYIQDYQPITELEKRPPDIRLSKKSLLKSGLRADFLEDSDEVKASAWFQSYLEGENIEFYIEGSGGYCVANIDLISHEIYLTKQTLLAQLEPIIFFSHQTEYAAASDVIREQLKQSIEIFNGKSRLPLTLIESSRPDHAPLRLNRTMMRKIKRSLLFIADITPITAVEGKEQSQLIPSPNVCVEIGYALESKKTEQILLTHQQRPELEGEFPFNVPVQQTLQFRDAEELNKTLTLILENQLARFKLLF